MTLSFPTRLSPNPLSLASFLTLRKTTSRSLATMERDNRRLGSLLQVSGSLSRAEHAGMAALSAAVCALDLLSARAAWVRSEEHTSELQSLMRNSYAVFCLTKQQTNNTINTK